jgi:Glycosyltransferase family 87
VLWGLIAAGVAGRLVLAFATRGLEYDIDSFEIVRRALADHGRHVYSVVDTPGSFRWPYPPGYFPWIEVSDWVAGWSGLRYIDLIQLPTIAADAAIAWVVQWYLGWRGRSERERLFAVALVMLGPAFWLISGYHGQIDSVAILPAVVALVLWERDVGRRALVCGLLIGLAGSIKTVPLVMVVALLPTARSWREAALLVGAAAFVPWVALLPFSLADSAGTGRLGDYAGVPGAGGLSLVLQPDLARFWLTGPVGANGITQWIADHQKLWNGAVIAAVALWAWRRRPAPTVAATVLWLAFFAFGTGFFFQYLVWGLPFFIMAGYLRWSLILQLAIVVPAAIFYTGPYIGDGVVWVYVGFMLAIWAGWVVALVCVAGGVQRRGLTPLLQRVPLDRGEWWILGGLALWSLYPLAVLVRHGSKTGQVLTGADSPIPGDQLQYLSWIRDAGHHGLVSNLFDLAPSAHVFLHPLFLPAGVLGLVVGWPAALLALKPLGVAVLFAGFALYLRRMLPGDARVRWTALVAALFFVTPAAPLAWWAGVSGRFRLADLSGEMFPAGQLWGYVPTAIAVGLVPLALLATERGLKDRRRLWAAAGCGALAAWLHPWQGEVLLLLLGAIFVLRGRPLALAIPFAATLAPALYYFVLSRTDSAWEVAARNNELPHYPLWALALGLAPFLLTVPFAWRRARDDVQELALVLWIPAALLVYLVLAPSVPAHALEGLSLPAVVLAARALTAPRVPAWGAVALAAAVTLPGAVWVAHEFRTGVNTDTQPALILPDERRALDLVESSPRPGGVYAPAFLGLAIPAETGRATWIGHPTWTPDYLDRAVLGERLFENELPPAVARRTILATGAAFVVSDCRGRRDVSAALAPIALRRVRVGCATVWELRTASTKG